MFVIYFLLLFSVLPLNFLSFLILIMVFYLFQVDKKELILSLFLLGTLILSLKYRPILPYQAYRVEKISENKIHLKSFFHRVNIPFQNDLRPGDFLLLKNSFSNKQTFNNSRLLEMGNRVEFIKHYKIPSFQGLIYSKSPKVYQELYLAKNNLVSSLSLQFQAFYFLFKKIEKRIKGNFNGIRFLLIYRFFFPSSLIWWRYFLNLVIKDPIKEIILIILIFPQPLRHAGFVFSYLPFLLKRFSNKLGSTNPSILFAQLSLYYFNSWNLLLIVFYPYLKYLFMIRNISLLFGVFSSSFLRFYFSIQRWFTKLISSSFFLRFSVYGTIPFLSFFVMISIQKPSHQWIFLLILSLFALYPPYARVSFIDVGQGDSTLISLPFNSASYLYDTGRSFSYHRVQDMIKKHGHKELDNLIISHDDQDHAENKESLILDYKIKKLFEEKVEKIDFIDVLLHEKIYGDENEDSLILYFNLYGLNYLLLGDAYQKQERDIMRLYPFINVDIMALGHHGSKTSSNRQFLAYFQPRYAIISSNPNHYGHPHPETLKNLYDLKISKLETSSHGNINIYSTPWFHLLRTDRKTFVIIQRGDRDD